MKILGYFYKILPAPEEDIGGMSQSGRIHIAKQTIHISPDACMQSQETAILHEIIEALNYHLDLNLGHDKIMALEAGLYTVLTDNHIILDPLLRELRQKEKK